MFDPFEEMRKGLKAGVDYIHADGEVFLSDRAKAIEDAEKDMINLIESIVENHFDETGEVLSAEEVLEEIQVSSSYDIEDYVEEHIKRMKEKGYFKKRSDNWCLIYF